MAKNSGIEPISSQVRTYTDFPSWSVALSSRLCRFELPGLLADGGWSAELEEPDASVSVPNARVAHRPVMTRDDRAHESTIDDMEGAQESAREMGARQETSHTGVPQPQDLRSRQRNSPPCAPTINPYLGPQPFDRASRSALSAGMPCTRHSTGLEGTFLSYTPNNPAIFQGRTGIYVHGKICSYSTRVGRHPVYHGFFIAIRSDHMHW